VNQKPLLGNNSFIHWFMRLHISSNFVKMKTAEESKSIMEGGPLNSSPKTYVHWGRKKNKKTDINSFLTPGKA
jgi:hypothetical protein